MPNSDILTRKQKQLVAELQEICALTRLDYANILEYDSEERTARLELMKNQIIRSQVLFDYVFVDEMLGGAICHYFFGKKKGSARLWRTKKFSRFNYYILEILSLNEKLRLMKAIAKVPKAAAKNIEELNALRNSLAHAFFPENLRAYKERGRKNKPSWKGKHIFTVDGLKGFLEDMSELHDFFLYINFGVSTREPVPKTKAVMVATENHTLPVSSAR